MPGGFQVFNESGGFVIDGSYMNLSLASKSTAATVPNGNFNQTRFTYSSPSAVSVPPILAIQCPVRVVISGPVVSGNTYDWLVVSYAGATSVTGFVFVEPAKSGNTYGLQVFNENEDLVFDATFPYMRVIDLIAPPETNNAPDAMTRTYQGVESIAFFQNTLAVEMSCFQLPETPPRMQMVHVYHGASAIGNVLDMGRQAFSLQQYGVCGQGIVKRDSSITVIDVSGL